MILEEESSGSTAAEANFQKVSSPGGLLRPAEPVGFGEPGIPTGNIDFQPTVSVSPARLIVQTATVLLAALLVGIVVFLVVRAAVGSGDDADDVGIDDSTIIDPGPVGDEALGGDNSTRSGSRRSTAEDGEIADSGDPDALLADEDAADGELATSAPSDTSVPGPSSTISVQGDDDDPQTTSSVPLGSTSITTAGPLTTTPPTTGSTVATSIPAPTASSPSTDAPATSAGVTTTDAPTVTTLPASTTATSASSTSQPQPPVVDLIGLPSEGDTRRWDTFTRFRSEAITGATNYCWTFTSAGGTRKYCVGDQLFDLPAAPDDVFPGSVTVTAQAVTDDGTVLAEDRITINFQGANFAELPVTGDVVDLSDGLLLESRKVLGADRYCWAVEQPGGVTTGEMCDSGERMSIDVDDPRLNGLTAAPASVEFAAYRGSLLIADEGIRIELR